MNEACAYICNFEDFQSFSKVKTQVNNFNCKVLQAVFKAHNERLIFYVSANRFLRGMVRAMVGTLMEIGLRKIAPHKIQDILEARDRRRAGPAAPAHGLTLSKVEYPKHTFI
jgi:tRNA pseudouridine38-40 synthase